MLLQFHILSGEIPFGAGRKVPMEILERVLKWRERPEAPLGGLQGGAELEAVMRDCWACEPGQRPTMGEVLERLEELE